MSKKVSIFVLFTISIVIIIYFAHNANGYPAIVPHNNGKLDVYYYDKYNRIWAEIMSQVQIEDSLFDKDIDLSNLKVKQYYNGNDKMPTDSLFSIGYSDPNPPISIKFTKQNTIIDGFQYIPNGWDEWRYADYLHLALPPNPKALFQSFMDSFTIFLVYSHSQVIKVSCYEGYGLTKNCFTRFVCFSPHQGLDNKYDNYMDSLFYNIKELYAPNGKNTFSHEYFIRLLGNMKEIPKCNPKLGSIISEKGYIDVTAYNLTKEDYPLFKAYIENNFIIKSDYEFLHKAGKTHLYRGEYRKPE